MIAAFLPPLWIVPRFEFLSKRGRRARILKATRAEPQERSLMQASRAIEGAGLPAPHGPDRATIDRFTTLMLPHLDAAYNFARYLTRGGHHAEDIVHEAFVRALDAFSGYRGGDTKAWLLTIVRNCFISSARRRSEIAASDAMPDVADDADTPEAALARRQTSETMRRLIRALPANLAEVIVLREVEDLSYKEIAVIIDAPIGTVMSRLARARDALAKAWRDETGEGAP